MRRFWSLGGLSLRELLRRTVKESWEDEVFGQAARLAFYHFLALFPSLMLVLLILDRLPGPGFEIRKTLETSLNAILPGTASQLVMKAIGEIGRRAAHGSLLFASLSALWAAFNGTWAVISGLNDAFEVEEDRPWWKVTTVTAGLTMTLALMSFVALTLLLFGHRIGAFIMDRYGMPTLAMTVWQLLHWGILAGVLLIAFALYYRFAPNLPKARLRWATPGAATATALWILATVLFQAYVNRSPGKYEQIYGSVASAAILLLWFYVTGAAILIGGEMNSEIENAADQHGHPDERRPGERRHAGRPPKRQAPL